MTISKKFPLFVDISTQKIVIIGGGNIAQRRLETLLEFNGNITLVSPDITEKIKSRLSDITYISDFYKKEYIYDAWLVLACTDNREVNRQVGIDAKENSAFVSVCDNKDECNFYFPAVAFEDDVTVGICGNGSDHKKTKQLAEKIRGVLN